MRLDEQIIFRLGGRSYKFTCRVLLFNSIGLIPLSKKDDKFWKHYKSKVGKLRMPAVRQFQNGNILGFSRIERLNDFVTEVQKELAQYYIKKKTKVRHIVKIGEISIPPKTFNKCMLS